MRLHYSCSSDARFCQGYIEMRSISLLPRAGSITVCNCENVKGGRVSPCVNLSKRASLLTHAQNEAEVIGPFGHLTQGVTKPKTMWAPFVTEPI